MKRLIAFLLVFGAILLEAQSSPPQPTVQILNAASHAPGMPGGDALATVLVTLPSADFLPGLQPGLFLPDPPTPAPHPLAHCPHPGKLSGIAQECVRHVIMQHLFPDASRVRFSTAQ